MSKRDADRLVVAVKARARLLGSDADATGHVASAGQHDLSL